MTYPKTKFRSAFTLVELLVVMTVIAILVGMLSAAVIPALARAKEAAIQVEMKQIELSIENFKNQYGFYPPSFVSITNAGGNTNAQCVATLLRYLNRISPNHQEAVGAIGSRPIDLWWAAVGTNIHYDDGDDLVFWLSGLCKNKQYPLTGDGIAPFPNAFDNDPTIERDNFYEFRNGQLVVEGVAAHYSQQAGKSANILYIDSASYGTDVGGYDGYHVLNQVPHVPVTPDTRWYENPKTFQLVCWGLDLGAGNSPSGNPAQWARQTVIGYAGLTDFVGQDSTDRSNASDNLCNFCDGRLDRLINGAFDSSAVEY